MKRPFLPGQTVAWLEPEPFGIRVHRATVLGIEPSKERDHWHITTDRGHATVNHTGESARILSIDNEIATDLYTRGDGFLVEPTLTDHVQIVRERKQELDTDIDADLGDDIGLG